MSKTITRAYLAETIHRQLGLSVSECAILVDELFEEIIAALAKDGLVKLSSFGSFKVKQKKARVGRNPKTKEEAVISPRNVVTFHASALLKRKMNGS